ncbi:hypothetical protein HYY75_11850, partial [bacterium]|nr:hypothetical protein [bacterium]
VQVKFSEAKKNPISRGWFFLGVFLGFFLVSSPFYLRNLILTGNPIFPHGNPLIKPSFMWDSGKILEGIPGEDLVPFQKQILTDRFGMGHEPLDLLLAPWNVSMNSHFHDEKWALRFFDGQISFIPLLSWGLCILLAIYAYPGAREFLALGLPFWLFWVLGSHQLRHLMPLVAIGAFLFGEFGESLGKRVSIIFWIAVIISMPWTGEALIERFNRTATVVAHPESVSEYLSKHFTSFSAIQWANRNLSSESKVLVLLEERTFLFDVPYIWTGIYPHWWINFVFRCGSIEKIEEILKKFGVTHIFLPIYGLRVFSEGVSEPGFLTPWKGLLQTAWKPIFQDQ